MKAVQVITGTGVPLKRSDVDTDQIIPADWLKRVERTGFEKGLFSTWRDDRDFVLNDERYAQANILVAGPAFGVGSSREHAVCAIQQNGFDALLDGLREPPVLLDRDHERRVIPQRGCGDHVDRLVDLATEAQDHVAGDVGVMDGARECPLELLNRRGADVRAATTLVRQSDHTVHVRIVGQDA